MKENACGTELALTCLERNCGMVSVFSDSAFRGVSQCGRAHALQSGACKVQRSV
jgi:hypothetical protein